MVILGATGRNYSAGMIGGIAYVFESRGRFESSINTELADFDIVSNSDSQELRRMIEKHYRYTNSSVASFILSDFDNQLKHFVKVFPRDYKRVMLASAVTTFETIAK